MKRSICRIYILARNARCYISQREHYQNTKVGITELQNFFSVQNVIFLQSLTLIWKDIGYQNTTKENTSARSVIVNITHPECCDHTSFLHIEEHLQTLDLRFILVTFAIKHLHINLTLLVIIGLIQAYVLMHVTCAIIEPPKRTFFIVIPL